MARYERDLAFAEAVVRGEEGAAEALFDLVFDRLYRLVCTRLGGDHHATQDIVSESLLAGLRGLRSFRGDAPLEGWFLRIAIRKIADHFRRRALELVSSGDGQLESVLRSATSGEASPLNNIDREETRLLVRKSLHSLPSCHRDVLIWKYFDDSSLGQVAQRLKVSEKAAERRLARARTALASALKRHGVGV